MWLYVLGGVLLLALILVGWVVGAYNSLISLSQGADKAWSNVETDYQRRFDLIPNLVETVKGIVKQEQTVFTEVAQLRSQWAAASTPDEKMRIAQASDSVLGRLIAVAEAYPQIKSNENFLALQDQLEGTENRITVSRQRYNEAVTAYNIKTMRVPSNIIANLFGFGEKELFKAAAGSEQAPGVKF
ncbi:LemA family protein [Candidatus Woesearchaeota archaeon]|nr:LemA family protein [Candidatus Woesearchaeota archaeon]